MQNHDKTFIVFIVIFVYFFSWYFLKGEINNKIQKLS